MTEGKDKKILIATSGIIIALAYVLKNLRRRKAPLYILKNGKTEVHVSGMGGIIQRLLVPDKDGKIDDIVLGHDTLDDYLKFNQYFGAVIGRVANRTAYGIFVADGKEYQLAKNDGSHHLHGGKKGWDKATWTGEQFQHEDGQALKLTYTSKDGEEGYPGEVKASITYVLKPDNSLRTIFEASSDKTTPINMAQHSYFNLAGHSGGSILGHRIHINGTHYTPKGDDGIPTGEISPIQGTAFDFTDSRIVGKRIQEVDGGYDHNYVLFGKGKDVKSSVESGQAAKEPKLAAELEDPQSGRIMKVLTTAPGLQFYTGNFIENVKGKGGAVYQKHAGLCLETQAFPNSVNEVAFPVILYGPGERYHHEVIYQFRTR